MHTPPILRSLGMLALLAASTVSQTISGWVHDAGGQPVPAVNLDAVDQLTGQEVLLQNDGTNITGAFVTTLPGPGVYRVLFKPPKPPQAQLLVTTLDDVVVVGDTPLGIVVLAPGVVLSGTVIDAQAFPVAGVDLDLTDLGAGQDLVLPNDTTDAFGTFSVVAPFGAIELQFDPSPLPITLAPHALELTLQGDVDLGMILLPPGFVLDARVLGPGGQPVAGADTDTVDLATQDELFTPHDNTDGSGFVDVVVPAGTYAFEVCPKAGSELVALETGPVAVSADTSLGTLILQAGEVLSGTVTDASGLPLAGIDVDVTDDVTGMPVLLCGDTSGASGNYAVVVPVGTLTVVFEPSFSQPHGSDVHAGVVVAGPTTLEGSLPDCPFPLPYGTGLAGSGGFVPRLASSGGAPRLGNAGWALEVDEALGGSLFSLLVGFQPASAPFKGGTLLVDLGGPRIIITPLPLGGAPGAPGAGQAFLPVGVPVDPLLTGTTLFLQAFVNDPGAAAGLSMTAGLQVSFCS